MEQLWATIKENTIRMTDFESIIRDGYYYVDKTQYIEKVENGRFFSLSVPSFREESFPEHAGSLHDINKKDKFEKASENYIYRQHPRPANKYLVLTLNQQCSQR